MARDTVRRAQQQSEQLLLKLPVLENVIARRELFGGSGVPVSLTQELGRELCASRERDGSWQRSVTRTAEHLLLLRELDPDGVVAETAQPGVEWLLDRVTNWRAAARAGGGSAGTIAMTICTPLLHDVRLCVHAAPDLVSVVPTRADLSGLRLLNGAGFISDTDARVAACALAVTALLQWHVDAAALQPQLDALQRIAGLEEHQRVRLLSTNGSACVALALHAAAVAAHGDAQQASLAAERALRVLVRNQRGDGSWPSADLFFVLGVLARAAADPRFTSLLHATLERSAQQLALVQQPDGGWSRDRGSASLLVGWRVLRAALSEQREALLAI